MEKAPFTNSNAISPAKGRILTGIFKSGAGKVKTCDVFSKLFLADFEVIQLGINFKPAIFIQVMKRFAPHVLILFYQGNIDGIKKLIEVMKKEEMRSRARIILYDPEINESTRDEVHADACVCSEQELFDMANEIVNKSYS